MKRALVLFAVLQPLVTPPAFGGVPELNIKAVCNARSADAKILHHPPTRAPRTVCLARKLQNSSSAHFGHQPPSAYGIDARVMLAR